MSYRNLQGFTNLLDFQIAEMVMKHYNYKHNIFYKLFGK
jgi:hypothetical protein